MSNLHSALTAIGYVRDENVGTWYLPIGDTGRVVWVTNGSGEAPTDEVAFIGVHEDGGDVLGWPAEVDAASLAYETRWHAERAMDENWPGARVERREPAYGNAARRYSAVHDFGQCVLDILTGRTAGSSDDAETRIKNIARSLNLLGEEVRP